MSYDPNKKSQQGDQRGSMGSDGGNPSGPEPPLGWSDASNPPNDAPSSQSNASGLENTTLQNDPNGFQRQKLESARKLILAAQIIAIVSLFIGGVAASTAAVVLAVIGYRQISEIIQSIDQPEVKAALKRAGVVALVVSIAALVMNAVALAFLWPEMMQILQTGDYSSLFGGTAPSPSSGTSTTWG